MVLNWISELYCPEGGQTDMDMFSKILHRIIDDYIINIRK